MTLSPSRVVADQPMITVYGIEWLAGPQASRHLSAMLPHGRKYQELPHPPGKELVSGESALYLERSYRIEVVADGALEIHFT